MVRAALVVVACALIGGAPTIARETVTVRVSPAVSMAPATVRIAVTVEPADDNRELELVADSGAFYTSSTVQLDGSKAPRLQWFTLKELPAGTYELSVNVIQTNGDKRQATAEYRVVGEE
jgi:hypothetical protein